MRLRRLGWAGVELEARGERLVVDHLLDPGVLAHFFGEERDELITPDPGGACAALVTHLHRDHTDVTAIAGALSPDGIVLRPERREAMSKFDEVATGEAERAFTDCSLDVRSCRAGDTVEVGPFVATAKFASDGLGSPQVSWMIEAEGVSVFHGGDTLWHGAWWDIALAHDQIDIACLPANGVEIAYPHLKPPAAVPAVMTPHQAVEAARVLRTHLMVPIHYNRTFEHPEYYRPVADAAEQIRARAAERGVSTRFLEPGEWHEIEAVAARA
ncbi:MAG: MBL fold metallo-hydrolase [Solirubrobacteraceae bacterium]